MFINFFFLLFLKKTSSLYRFVHANWIGVLLYVLLIKLYWTSTVLSNVVYIPWPGRVYTHTMYAKWKSFPLTVSCLKIKFRLKGKLNYVLFIKRNCFTVRTSYMLFEKNVATQLRKCKVYSIDVWKLVHSLKVLAGYARTIREQYKRFVSIKYFSLITSVYPENSSSEFSWFYGWVFWQQCCWKISFEVYLMTINFKIKNCFV